MTNNQEMRDYSELIAKLCGPAAVFYEFCADNGKLLRDAAMAIDAIVAERDQLRAELSAIKGQEPVGRYYWESVADGLELAVPSATTPHWMKDDFPLYAGPVAPAQAQVPPERIADVIQKLMGECHIDWVQQGQSYEGEDDGGFNSDEEERDCLIHLINEAMRLLPPAPTKETNHG